MTELETKLLAQLKGLLSDIEGLMGESSGVYGLHLNGDVSPWDELDEGGRFERLPHLSSARSAIAEATNKAPQPSADGWIPWEGGERPVEHGTKVDVRHRDGNQYQGFAGYSIALRWDHDNHPRDIIAYRVVKEPPAQAFYWG